MNAQRQLVQIFQSHRFVQLHIIGSCFLTPIRIRGIADVHPAGLVAEESAMILELLRIEITGGNIGFGMR